MEANELLSIVELSDQKVLVPVDPSLGKPLSGKDQIIFDAVIKLCESSELYAVEPVVFSEGTGIYKHGNLFFERRVVNLYDPPFHNEREYEHYLQRVDADTAQKLQTEWRGSSTQIVGEIQGFAESANDVFPESFVKDVNKSKEN